ncbi:lipopolysaccharide biosynthesis protein [Pontibacter cellulosilyticus]|uniref:MATE family efflux transporter n=1 Tax=Pontibacter cellulosilyticus TaxID=1720253 RepID=A0A923N450_9BACT|nr:MATE family efflux transporter [Pontibacter cellulosilyticus]MBC5992535.1 MATE family efflux transporter [Pontibacter cellulosilyticus]
MNNKTLRWNLVFQYGYTITNIINSLVLLPVYIKFIDSNILGLWLATGNILAWITMSDPGIGDILQQKIAELKGEKKDSQIGATIGSGLLACMLVFIISILVGIIFYYFIDNILGEDVLIYNELRIAIIISIVSTSITLLSFGTAGINQGMHKSANVAISYISSNLLFLLINICLLYFEFGVVSIAIANLVRAIFLTAYNTLVILREAREGKLHIILNLSHFKKFIKIFSVTSVSKVITTVSNNMDLIILARYLPGSFITLFEVNRRPIKMAQSLIGRYSVALMPLLSHAKGTGNYGEVTTMLAIRIKYYFQVLLFVSFILCLNYEYLISMWTSKDQFAGHTIIYLLIGSFFFGTMGYFMSNISFALGEIRFNSIISSIKGVLSIILSIIGVVKFGIIGVLVSVLFINFLLEFIVFTLKVYKLNYLNLSMFKGLLNIWSIVIPIGLFLLWGEDIVSQEFYNEYSYSMKLLISTLMFCLPYLAINILIDSELRQSMIKSKEYLIKKLNLNKGEAFQKV